MEEGKLTMSTKTNTSGNQQGSLGDAIAAAQANKANGGNASNGKGPNKMKQTAPKTPTTTDALTYDLDSDLAPQDVAQSDDGAADEARREQEDARSGQFNGMLHELPSSVAQVIFGQRTARLSIEAKLAKPGTTATERDMLRDQRSKLDNDTALSRRRNGTFGKFTTDEAAVVTRMVRFAEVTSLAMMCPPNWWAIGYVADRGIELGVFTPVSAGANRKDGVVKVGRDRFLEMSPAYKATAVDMRSTWPKAMIVKGVEVPAYRHPLDILGALASGLAREASQRWQESLTALQEGVTPNLNVIGVEEKGEEGTLVITDPGDEEHDGGKVKVTVEDGTVAFVAGHGNTWFRGKIDQIADANITVTVADLGLSAKDARAKYKGLAFAAFMIASRAFKHERAIAGQAAAKQETATKALAEVTATAKAAAGGRKLIHASDFHAGTVGVAVLVLSTFSPSLPVRKNGEIVRDDRDRFKTQPVDFNDVAMAVERTEDDDGVKRIVIHGVAKCHAEILAEIPAGSTFHEVNPDDRSDKPYSGVNNPARYFLRCSLGETEKQKQAATASTETAATATSSVKPTTKRTRGKAKADGDDTGGNLQAMTAGA
ncbi:MAG: hypothetical protein HY457_00085 [Parcubacteria group bacterium]|nr:hypothetical protein [Parcubacteria group bacterium]